MGPLGAPRNGPQTASEAQQSQAFEQHLGANDGGNGRRSNVYGPTGLHQVASNNAALFVHHNAGPFSVDENASRLEAHDNHDAFTLRHNALSSRLLATNNDGRLDIGGNDGDFTSVNNANMEHVGSNSQQVHLQNNNGSHDLGTNTGYVHVDAMGPNGRVHIDHQSGIVHQSFPPGSLMHRLHPNGVDHQATGNPLTLHAHGQDSLVHNPVGQLLRHPTRTIAEALGLVAGGVGVGAIYANNAAAIPESGHGSAGEFGMNATRAGR